MDVLQAASVYRLMLWVLSPQIFLDEKLVLFVVFVFFPTLSSTCPLLSVRPLWSRLLHVRLIADTVTWWWWLWCCNIVLPVCAHVGRGWLLLWWLWGTAKVWFRLLWDPFFLCVVCCVAEASAVGVGPYEVDQSSQMFPRETFPLSEQFLPISSLVITLLPSCCRMHFQLRVALICQKLLIKSCYCCGAEVFLVVSSSPALPLRCSAVTVYCPPPKVSMPILYFSLSHFRPR